MTTQVKVRPAGAQLAVVLGATADIGHHICKRLLAEGWQVVGLGRSDTRVSDLRLMQGFTFHACDLANAESVKAALAEITRQKIVWDLFVSCAGTMEPIGRFFDLDFDDWAQSTVVNFTAQLRVLHGLWPLRRQYSPVHIMLMAGGGTNNSFTNYSAYCVSKIALIKMVELIDDEEGLANAFIIGPGFVHTRMHEETQRAGNKAGPGLAKTQAFLKTPGTSLDDIYQHLRWCMDAGRGIAGGRNFSTVHDHWRGGGDLLRQSLAGDCDAFKLRRHKDKTE